MLLSERIEYYHCLKEVRERFCINNNEEENHRNTTALLLFVNFKHHYQFSSLFLNDSPVDRYAR